MREYDEATLKRVQTVELGILKDFIAICDANNLTYFGIAGTGIGALRHQGFIPWDDDIDIAMPRKDLNHLIEIIDESFTDKYFVMNFEHNENYPLMTTRLMLRGTVFREHAFKDIDCPFGIFLDLYAYDNISDDPKLFKKQCRDAFFWSKMLILRSIPFPVLAFKGFKAKLVHAACWLIHSLMRLLHIKKKWLYDRCYEASTRYNYMENTTRIDFLCDTTPYMNIYKKSDVFPLVKMPFEDIELFFPNSMHENLTGMYGNYMELPPVEKRKNHFPFKLSFGNGVFE